MWLCELACYNDVNICDIIFWSCLGDWGLNFRVQEDFHGKKAYFCLLVQGDECHPDDGLPVMHLETLTSVSALTGRLSWSPGLSFKPVVMMMTTWDLWEGDGRHQGDRLPVLLSEGAFLSLCMIWDVGSDFQGVFIVWVMYYYCFATWYGELVIYEFN